jgi:hypothetical protein
MQWNEVGSWIKENAGTGAALVGSLLVGNVPGAIAAGVSLVSGATGTDDPAKALEALQSNPETLLKLKELAFKEEDSIRKHLEEMTRLDLEDKQSEHTTTQATIQSGDNATDEYVRRTRPKMAKESWLAGCSYVFMFEVAELFDVGGGASIEIAAILFGPALAYLGMRTIDKWKHK